MRLLIFFGLFCACFWTSLTDSDDSNDLVEAIAQIVNVAINFVLINVRKVGNITLVENGNYHMPNGQTVVEGVLNVTDLHFYGLSTLEVTSSYAKASTTQSDTLNIVFNATFDQMGLDTGYGADIGIVEQIPIYGAGVINLAISSVEANVSVDVNLKNLSDIYVSDIDVYLNFRDSPFAITGFWRNDNVSNILSTALSVAGDLVAMFWNYETDCISCVVSPAIKYVINDVLKHDQDPLSIQCPCLKHLFSTQYDLEKVVNTTLEAIVSKDVGGLLRGVNKNEAEAFLQPFVDQFINLLNSEGFY